MALKVSCFNTYWLATRTGMIQIPHRSLHVLRQISNHQRAIPAHQAWSPPFTISRRQIKTSSAWSPQLGTEPGLDSSSQAAKDFFDANAHTEEEVTIKIVDYSATNTDQHEIRAASFDGFLKNNPKPDWAHCRWVYVNGIDQEVLRSLGTNYKLHRLALEDVLESRGPTKADWYDGHLFIAMPLHKVLSPLPLEDKHEEHRHRFAHHQRHHKDWRTIAHQKFNIAVEQVSIFWTNTGTVITVFQKSGEDVLKPILNRLDSPHSVLRSANDPSMLIQAIVDTTVDLCMPIEKAFADEFTQIELTVLNNPALQQSRQLYILRSRLTLLLDNFIAINSLLKKLCGDHPANSAAPLPGTSSDGRDRIQLDSGTNLGHNSAATHVTNSVSISPTTQLYLRDVLDHVRTLSASTDVAIRSTENLTSLIFNTIAASQNESVRQLTVVSSFFLPLTFLSGYFGMNFEHMAAIEGHTDLVFWAIAAPAVVSMGLFMRMRARRKMFPDMTKHRATRSSHR